MPGMASQLETKGYMPYVVLPQRATSFDPFVGIYGFL